MSETKRNCDHLKKYQFKKGHTGNPRGSKKLSNESKFIQKTLKDEVISVIYLCLTDMAWVKKTANSKLATPLEIMYAREIVRILAPNNPKTHPVNRLQKLETILSRAIGKPRESVDLDQTITGPNTLEAILGESLAAIKKIRKQSKELQKKK